MRSWIPAGIRHETDTAPGDGDRKRVVGAVVVVEQKVRGVLRTASRLQCLPLGKVAVEVLLARQPPVTA